MRKIMGILMISILFSFCACGNSNGNYKYQPEDVTAKNEEAQSLYDKGAYEDSLEIYLEAVQENPKDVNAHTGVVKCQIAMENYDLALLNLDAAVRVSPQTEEIYELYLEISELTDNISTAQTAVTLAKNYGVESFLEKVPGKPVLGYEGGTYDQRIEVSVESEEEGVEIRISVSNPNGYSYSITDYDRPWIMTSGETKLTAYCVKDGIPGEAAEATYVCQYAPSVVQFEDPIMEQLVRNVLGKTEGEITDIDCEQVTSLDSNRLYSDGIDYETYRTMKLHSLSDLQYFPNLNSFSLYEQPEIEDYSKITLCPFVRNLYMRGCGIEDISFIPEMPCLSYLYLTDNQVKDITPLIQCSKLNGIDVSGNPLNDIEGLLNLEKLTNLTVDVSQMKDVSILQQFDSLDSLSLYRHDDIDLSVLGEMTQLQYLYIAYKYQENENYEDQIFLKDISYLQNLTGLTALDISGLENLSQTEYLKGLKNLENLYLYNRKERDAEKDDAIIRELQQALPQCNIRY